MSSDDLGLCTATIQRGRRCRNAAVVDGLCHVHAPPVPQTELPPRPEEAPEAVGPPPPSFDLHRVAGVAGETHGDRLRHAYLRAHFMNSLLTDSRVGALFGTWGKQTALHAAADAVAEAGSRLASAANVRHWSDLAEWPEERAGPPGAVIGAILGGLAEGEIPPAARPDLGTFVEAVEHYVEAIEHYGSCHGNELLAPAPAAFVRETLGLLWAWLAYELVDCFSRDAQARAFGLTETRSYTVELNSPPAPPHISWRAEFEVAEGETVADARERLMEVAAEAWQALSETLDELQGEEQSAIGKRPKADTRYLQDWAQWFYRARVKTPPDSVASIAREVSRDRRTIDRAIREAERFMSLGVYTLRE